LRWLLLALLLGGCDVRGYRSEGAPWTFPEGQYAQFQNLTLESGTIRPRGSDEEYTPGATGFLPFLYANLGLKSMEDLDFGETIGVLLAHCPLTGGAPKLRREDGTEYPLTLTAPSAPTLTGCSLIYPHADDEGILEPGEGLEAGEERTYAYAASDGAGAAGGLSDPLTVWRTPKVLFVDTLVGDPPGLDDTVTSAGGGTATVLGADWSEEMGWILVEDAKGTFAAGNALAWTGGSTSLLSALQDLPGLYVMALHSTVTFPTDGAAITGAAGATAVAVGTGIKFLGFGFTRWVFLKSLAGEFKAGDVVSWAGETGEPIRAIKPVGWAPDLSGSGQLHTLDGAGTWHRTDNTAYSLDELATAPVYEGPLDDEALPETLSHLTTADLVCEHNGSLFVAVGRYLYPSERFSYRSFVTRRRIDCRDPIVGLVSRAEVLEIYTTRRVYLLVGDYPAHALRDLQTVGGPSAWDGLASCSAGTFFLQWDEQTPTVFRLTGQGLAPITRGVHTPWLRGLSGAEDAILGADEGFLMIVRKTAVGGKHPALCWDFHADEWWTTELDALPLGFRYDPTDRVLVSRTGVGAYVQHGTGTAAVPWVLELKPDRHERFEEGPLFLLFDADGALEVDVLADGVRLQKWPVTAQGEREETMPEGEAKHWRYVLTGTGTASDTEIRSVSRG
jgi:hypothetical protein